VFANCGAVAGTLARLDEQRPPWQPGPDEELLLRLGTRPRRVLVDAERQRLAAHGINPLQALRSTQPRVLPLKTLAGGTAGSADSALLTTQRRRLLVMNSIELGTRWALFAASDRVVWRKLERQVQAFLQPLAEAGLFGPPEEPGAFQAICDERLNGADEVDAGRINLLVSLRSSRPGIYSSFVVTHGREGSSVRPVRSTVLPAGARMSVPAEERKDTDETQRQRALSQARDDYYQEPRPPSVVVRNSRPKAPPAGGLDAETIAAVHRELGSGGQRF
jgi:hypothetical protein